MAIKIKELRTALKKVRKLLAKKALELPDEDAFATPYSILVDAVRDIDQCLADMGPALKEAKAYRKKNPNQSRNRAIQWVGKP